jgi:hypothetical protein
LIAPQLNSVFQKGFAKTARLLLKKDFGGLYLSKESAFGGERAWPSAQTPLFLFANHVAWQDALVGPEICVNQMRRRSLAPMDEAQFESHKSLRYVGIFGVKRGDGPAAQMLIEDEFRRHPETCIWIHPEGIFQPSYQDCNEFRSGLSRWSNKEGFQRVPVALVYLFGPESKPNIFVKLGANCPPQGLGIKEDSEFMRSALSRTKRELYQEALKANTGSSADYSSFVRLL